MANYGELVMSANDSYKLQILTKFLTGKLFRDEAAKLLQVSERTVSRYSKKLKDLGPIGVKHGNFRNKRTQKWDNDLIFQILEILTELAGQAA